MTSGLYEIMLFSCLYEISDFVKSCVSNTWRLYFQDVFYQQRCNRISFTSTEYQQDDFNIICGNLLMQTPVKPWSSMVQLNRSILKIYIQSAERVLEYVVVD